MKFYFIYSGHERMVNMLLRHGADVNKSDFLNKFTPFHLANKNRGCGVILRWGCGKY